MLCRHMSIWFPFDHDSRRFPMFAGKFHHLFIIEQGESLGLYEVFPDVWLGVHRKGMRRTTIKQNIAYWSIWRIRDFQWFRCCTYQALALCFVARIFRCRIIDGEIPCAVFMNSHNGSQIATSVTVIRGWPNGDQLVIEHVLVPLLHQLMGTSNQLQIIDVVELIFNQANRGVHEINCSPLSRHSRQKANLPHAGWPPNSQFHRDRTTLNLRKDSKESLWHRKNSSFIPQNAPSWGISWARDNVRMESRVRISGDSPPCTQRVVPSMICQRVRKNFWRVLSTFATNCS
jgi:hypothetical protein